MHAPQRNARGMHRAATVAVCGLAALAALGVATSGAGAASADVLSCAATSAAGGTVACTVPIGTPTTADAAPTAQTTAPAPASGTLQTVRVITSTGIVYPSASGYSKSSVRFSVSGLTAARSDVPISGTAVLRKGAAVVRTWTIASATTALAWDGRVNSEVRAGRYTLTVTGWSADGASAVTTTKVRVSAKHLVTRTVSVRTRDLARARTDTLPVAVVRGFTYGRVTLRTHTAAKVSGPASLVISGPYGEQFSVPLRNGRHATRSGTLPREFTSATFHHRWAKGAAKLIDLYTVFTFKQLV